MADELIGKLTISIKEIVKKHTGFSNDEWSEDRNLVEWINQPSNRIVVEEEIMEQVKSAKRSHIINMMKTMNDDDVKVLIKKIVSSDNV